MQQLNRGEGVLLRRCVRIAHADFEGAPRRLRRHVAQQQLGVIAAVVNGKRRPDEGPPLAGSAPQGERQTFADAEVQPQVRRLLLYMFRAMPWDTGQIPRRANWR